MCDKLLHHFAAEVTFNVPHFYRMRVSLARSSGSSEMLVGDGDIPRVERSGHLFWLGFLSL